MLNSISKSVTALGQEVCSRWNALHSNIGNLDLVAVAFSGGVDSGLLATAAYFALGENMTAFTIHSPVNSEDDLINARSVANEVGFRLVVIEYDDLTNPLFASNPPDRCYHCKLGRFQAIQLAAARLGIYNLLEGSNVEDGADYRPGSRAVIELGGHSPLREAGLGKADIRSLARVIGLSIWDRPSVPCLATRFPYGTPLTPAGLQLVDRGEKQLREWGFGIVRMRVHADIVRLEVSENQIIQVMEIRDKIVRFFREMGFAYVTIDLAGYHMGSMNFHLNL